KLNDHRAPMSRGQPLFMQPPEPLCETLGGGFFDAMLTRFPLNVLVMMNKSIMPEVADHNNLLFAIIPRQINLAVQGINIRLSQKRVGPARSKQAYSHPCCVIRGLRRIIRCG